MLTQNNCYSPFFDLENRPGKLSVLVGNCKEKLETGGLFFINFRPFLILDFFIEILLMSM